MRLIFDFPVSVITTVVVVNKTMILYLKTLHDWDWKEKRKRERSDIDRVTWQHKILYWITTNDNSCWIFFFFADYLFDRISKVMRVHGEQTIIFKYINSYFKLNIVY